MIKKYLKNLFKENINELKPVHTPNKCCKMADGIIGTSKCWCSQLKQ